MAFDYVRDPGSIYEKSFRTIEGEADLSRFDTGERDVAVRLIHACGMIDVVDDLQISAGAVEAGRNALKQGAAIFCDVEMVRHGIIASRLPKTNEIVCCLNDPTVSDLARHIGNTRSAAAVEIWGAGLEGAVVVIGNAPTALFHLLELMKEGAPAPALIIGIPVGFVGAVESKRALADSNQGIPFVTVHGRRGGSAMASSVVNALSTGNAV